MRTLIIVGVVALLGAIPAAAEDFKPPAPVGKPGACYPQDPQSQSEIRARREIHVVVCFNVAIDGTVKNVTIAKSGGAEILDQYARNCVSDWHYTPATKDGQPVEFPLITQMNWCASENPLHMKQCPSPPIAAQYKAICAKALTPQ